MASTRLDDIDFLRKFHRVACLQCVKKLPDHRLFALTCGHVFCGGCIPKVCSSDGQIPKVWLCGVCNKRGKFAPFSENLPASFLKRFEPVQFDDYLRRVNFQFNQRNSQLKIMNHRQNRLQQQIEEKQRQYKHELECNKKLEEITNALFKEASKYISPNTLDRLMKLPHEQLRNMDMDECLLGPGAEEINIRKFINADSPTPLVQQVLLKNASTSRSSNESDASSSTCQ